MKMAKSEVMNMLGISTLNDEIAENVLKLCGLKVEYDVEEVCRFYAKAVTFFREYLPEFYVSELIGMNVDELLNMNIEYMTMPVEMQCLFYDNYPEGKFRYSKFAYNSVQVYKVLDILSKSIFLEVPEYFAKLYEKSFISVEAAVTILGFTKVNPALYHFYLMKLDIRYDCSEGEKKYLIDDICNILEKSNEIFDKYLSFNEACELYSYNILKFLCNDNIPFENSSNILKYDVVSSDTRFKYPFRESQTFFDKNDVQVKYLDWFKRSTGSIINGLRVLNFCESKFECNCFETEILAENIYSAETGIEPDSLSSNKLTFYEYDPEYESINLLYKMWGLDEIKKKEVFESILRRSDIAKKYKSVCLYRINDFKEQYEKVAYSNALMNIGLRTMDSNEYFYSTNDNNSLSFYFKWAKTSSPNWVLFISKSSKEYVSVDIAKYWNNALDYMDNIDKKIIVHKKHQYISYIALRRKCLKQFYTLGIFDLHSNDDGLVKAYVNLDYTCLYSFNSNLQNSIRDDFSTAIKVKDVYLEKMSVAFLQHKVKSSIIFCETLDESNEFWPISTVITYLNIDKYSITLAWAILYNLELSIFYCCGNLYFIPEEILTLRSNIADFLEEYIPVKKLYYLLHESHPMQKLAVEIVAPPAMFYFLMPENNKGFYFIKKIPQKLLDDVYNESANCDTLLTAAEVQGNLNMLPSKIPSILAVHLLHIHNGLNKLNQTHSLYADSSNAYCKRDTVIKLINIQKFHQENYVLEDDIPKILNINIESLSEKDNEILKTISVYTTPDYIMHMSESKHLTNDRAYRKEDVHNLREFFHVPRNTQYDVKVDNNVSCKVPYQTYTTRLEPLGLKETLERISPLSSEIWDGYVRLQLSVQQRSEKGLNSMINQYIKTLNILINIFQENKITEISDLQTGIINRSFNSIGSITYSSILIGFFKYATIEYADKGIKPKYRIAELKIPTTKKENPDNILPEAYSFREYSKLFNYCNDYYMHIETAVNEILDHGTCTYASTWFYVMSHLNNAWRSSDFAMFPYIDILDVNYRNTSNEIKWYLNNRITKSDSTIIVLRIQSNPKVISKTKKYTRFTCSDELLETYATVYSLLVFYTSNYLCYNVSA